MVRTANTFRDDVVDMVIPDIGPIVLAPGVEGGERDARNYEVDH